MLSVCVIGRNEAERLPALIESLRPLRERGLAAEFIYVDSASEDDSIAVAQGFFDQVLVLEASPHLCASAGRHAGTLAARGDWILYLDGDMRLCPEFIPVLERLCAEPAGEVGWTGRMPYIYPDGRIRPNPKGFGDDGEVVGHIGGAFLLPRQAVLRAGNWRPCVACNEEIDLYTRMRAQGAVVRFADVPMVEHPMRDVPRWKKALGLFVPLPHARHQFPGFGQMIRARLREGSMASLVRYFPYPFVFWAFLLVALGALALGRPLTAGAVLAAACAFVWYAKGWHYVVLYLSYPVQLVYGWRRFDPHYVPRVAHRIERARTVEAGA